MWQNFKLLDEIFKDTGESVTLLCRLNNSVEQVKRLIGCAVKDVRLSIKEIMSLKTIRTWTSLQAETTRGCRISR